MAIYQTLLFQNPALAWLLIAGALMSLQAAAGVGFLIPAVGAAAAAALLMLWDRDLSPLVQILAFVFLTIAFTLAARVIRRLQAPRGPDGRREGRRRVFVSRVGGAEGFEADGLLFAGGQLTPRSERAGGPAAAAPRTASASPGPARPPAPAMLGDSLSSPLAADFIASGAPLSDPSGPKADLARSNGATTNSAIPSGAEARSADPGLIDPVPPVLDPSGSLFPRASPEAGSRNASPAPPASLDTGPDVRMIGRIARAKGAFHGGSGVVLIDGSERDAQIEDGQASPSPNAPVRVLGTGPGGLLRVRSLRS